MNRVIKFRAWGKMYSDEDFKMFAVPPVLWEESLHYHDDDYGKCAEEADWKLMQFTGLHDKNGVEIYEGDVVTDHVGTGVVKYECKYAAFRVSYGNGRAKWFYDYLESEAKSIEVIGNIYQNPELLA